ncbi:MAG: hypothetical protein EWM72_01307 [Nitrospira sp.]|nr:MAG: hypothetical protein EWM72_01307 [Nitrospira sp.]
MNGPGTDRYLASATLREEYRKERTGCLSPLQDWLRSHGPLGDVYRRLCATLAWCCHCPPHARLAWLCGAGQEEMMR